MADPARLDFYLDFGGGTVDLQSLEVVSKDDRKMTVRMKGVPLQYANALRRICLNGVPVFAIDTVEIIENSSVIPDEGLAHRLGLVPLRTDLERFREPSDCSCGGAQGCSNCRVMLVFDSEVSDSESTTVMSSNLTSEDPDVAPISGRIPIVRLAPGQKVKVECFARLGRGTEHAKWNSSNVSILVDGDEEGEHVLTIESTGALKPEQILLAGVAEVNRKLSEFKGVLDGLG